MNTTDKIIVDIWEYERGWGSRIDETKEFQTMEAAEDFIKEFNAENTELTVPDWYMVAKLREGYTVTRL